MYDQARIQGDTGGMCPPPPLADICVFVVVIVERICFCFLCLHSEYLSFGCKHVFENVLAHYARSQNHIIYIFRLGAVISTL